MQWLELLRREHGWSQAQMAKRVSERLGSGVSQVKLSRMERGEAEPALSELQAIAAACGLTPAELMDRIVPRADAIQRRAAQLGREAAAARDDLLEVARRLSRTCETAGREFGQLADTKEAEAAVAAMSREIPIGGGDDDLSTQEITALTQRLMSRGLQMGLNASAGF